MAVGIFHTKTAMKLRNAIRFIKMLQINAMSHFNNKPLYSYSSLVWTSSIKLIEYRQAFRRNFHSNIFRK